MCLLCNLAAPEKAPPDVVRVAGEFLGRATREELANCCGTAVRWASFFLGRRRSIDRTLAFQNLFLRPDNFLWQGVRAGFQAESVLRVLDPQVSDRMTRLGEPRDLMAGMAHAALAFLVGADHEKHAVAAYERAFEGLGKGIGEASFRVALTRCRGRKRGPQPTRADVFLTTRDDHTVGVAQFWAEFWPNDGEGHAPDPTDLGLLRLGDGFLEGVAQAWRMATATLPGEAEPPHGLVVWGLEGLDEAVGQVGVIGGAMFRVASVLRAALRGEDPEQAARRLAGEGVGSLLWEAGCPNTEQRRRALRALGGRDDLGGAVVVSALAGALSDPVPAVRQSAVRALGATARAQGQTEHSPVDRMIGALSDETVRAAAVEAVVRLGDSACNRLIEALAHLEEELRWAVARDLARAIDARPAQVCCLVSVLAHDDSRVRESVELALSRIQGAFVVQPLVDALSQSELRDAAAQLLSQRSQRSEIAESLALALPNSNGAHRAAIVRMLGGLGQSASDVLACALKSSDPNTRKTAADLLSQIREWGARTFEAVCCALADVSPAVRNAAALALGQRQAASAAETLARILNTSLDPAIRAAVTRGLGVLGKDQVLKPQQLRALIDALDSPCALVRMAAADTLVEALESAPVLLREFQRTRTLLVKNQILRILGRLKTATETLVGVLDDIDSDLAEAAELALCDTGPPAVGVLQKRFYALHLIARLRAVRVMGQLGACAVGPVALAVRDKALEVRLAAIETLGKMGPEASPLLIEALEDPEVRAAAALELTHQGPAAVSALVTGVLTGSTCVQVEATRILSGFSAHADRSGLSSDSPTTEAQDSLNNSQRRTRSRQATLADELVRVSPGGAGNRFASILFGALTHPDPEMRTALRTELPKIDGIVEFLVNALRGNSAAAREVAAQLLPEIGDAVVEPLIRTLASEETALVEAAAQALARVSPSPVRSLAEALGDPSVAAGVRRTLARLEFDQQTVQSLLSVDEEQGRANRDFANIILALAADPEHQSRAYAAVRQAGPPAAQPLACLFLDREMPLSMRIEAVVLGEEAFADCPNPDPYDRWLGRTSAVGVTPEEFAAATFELVASATRTNKSLPPQVIERFLCILGSSPDSPLLPALLRALYVSSGRMKDGVGWLQPQEALAVTGSLVKMIRDSRSDPVVVRYALFMLSQARNMTCEDDLVYELAYTADHRVAPPECLFRRIHTVSPELCDLVAKNLLVHEAPEIRYAAAIYLARLDWRVEGLAATLTTAYAQNPAHSSPEDDEFWAHLIRLDDTSALATLQPLLARPLSVSGRIALGWLFRSAPQEFEVLLAANHPERETILAEVAELGRSFTVQSNKTDPRWQQPSAVRSYDEAGHYTTTLCRSRGNLIYLVRGDDHTKRKAWYYVQVRLCMRSQLQVAVAVQGQIQLTDYGRIISSGYGQNPPRGDADWMCVNYGWIE